MIALVLLVACSGSESDSGSATGGDVSVELVTPTEGSTVCGTPLFVEFEVFNMELVPWEETPENPQPGTGHADIVLNGQDATMVWVTTAEIDDVPDGEYQIKVELSNADHTPVTPYAGDLAYITVAQAVCSG